jgi:hypothetical protein
VVQWVVDPARLRRIAGALMRSTECMSRLPGRFAVSPDGTYLQYTVRVRTSSATVRVAVSETKECINLHLPGSKVAYIRKSDLPD